MRKIKRVLCTTGVVLGYCLAAYAAENPTTNDQLNNMRRQADEQQSQIDAPWVQMQANKPVNKSLVLPQDATSFYIRKINVTGSDERRFDWLKELAEQYQDRKIGLEGVNMLAKYLSEQLISAGYVTSKIVVPNQDISTGTLTLNIIPGKISNIRFENPDTRGTWRNAFPCSIGDILNVRALEQGLEQMKRLPNQDVNMKLVPGAKTGESEVIISVRRTKPWNVGISLDNAGLSTTGKVQIGSSVSLYNPTWLNDILTYRYGQNVEGVGDYGSSNYGISYSVPWGYYTFSVNKYHSDFNQIIPSIVPFKSSGQSDVLDVGFQRVIQRDRTRKTQLSFKIIQKENHSYINNTEIEVQKQITTAYQLGLIYRQYAGNTTIDAMLYYQKGMPWLGAQQGLADKVEGLPTTRYGLGGMTLNVATPVKLGSTQGRYTFTMRGQVSMDKLYSTEQFAIGGRYTVRGFDGEYTLAAENGVLIRNELSIPIKKLNMQTYVGLDAGYVWGPSAQYLLGNKLVGTVLGVRGSALKNLQYDAFVGTPLYKPRGFKTAKATFGFSLYLNF